MIMNEHFKFLTVSKISDGLLREFVLKGLWKQAIVAINTGIDKRLAEVEKLKGLRGRLEDELGTPEPQGDDVSFAGGGVSMKHFQDQEQI